jgi:hypothetical protein
MFCKSFCLLILSCIVTILAAPNQSIPFSKLGTEATKKTGNKGLSITELWNGYRLECRMQDLQAEVTMNGTTIRSTSESEGEGEFSIRAAWIGRENAMKEITALVDFVDADDGAVRSRRGNVVEEYTVSGDGIKQDFIITSRPGGKGRLVLELAVEGAEVRTGEVDGAIEIGVEGGRKLVYHALNVMDATGKTLEARFGKFEKNCMAVEVEDRGAEYPVRIDPIITDADWVSMGGQVPGVNSTVYALAVNDSGSLFVGGNFISAGGDTGINYIAEWNGNSWNALGSGVNGEVYALEIDSAGNLYVGGHFNLAGGKSLINIAQWDGISWNAMDTGIFSTIYALKVDKSGNLYAGGNFNIAGTVNASRIAKWDGNNWSALGSGINGTVYCITVDSSDVLYAGGSFSSAGGTTANNIAKWDGNTWTALGSGLDSTVNSIAADGIGNIYAGGLFGTAGGVETKRVAKWDGSGWNAIGGGINYSGGGYSWVNALTTDRSGNLYVGGCFNTAGDDTIFNLAKWDGITWSAFGNGIDRGAFSFVFAVVADDSGNLYAGGDFGNAGDKYVSRIAMWDGSDWNALGNGINHSVCALAADDSSNLYAGGTFTAVGGKMVNYIARWDGSNWNAMDSGMNNIVSTLEIDKIGNLYAGGLFTTAGGITVNHIAKWNGNNWSTLNSGTNYNVFALSIDDSNHLYAGGNFTSAGDITVKNIAKWNGNIWGCLGSGTNHDVRAIEIDNKGMIYAGGSFDTAGGIAVNHIAKWDGMSWSALGRGMWYEYENSCVFSIAADGFGTIYAGGRFTRAGNVDANCIAKWDGTKWSGWGSGMRNSNSVYPEVRTLLLDRSGYLFAGGFFETVADVTAPCIAKWDSNTWSALSGGTNGTVWSMAVDKTNNLYVGGNFTIAGGKVSAYVAQCKIKGSAVKPSVNKNPYRIFPSFILHSNLIRIYFKFSTLVTYRLFTLTGREVYRDAQYLPKGDRSLKLNTAGLSQGTYIAQVKAGNESIRFQVAVK